MNSITLTTPSSQYTFSLADKIITIGKRCEEVFNSVAIDDDGISEFQCQIQYADDKWIIRNGQIRTECPKGLRSSKIVPCSCCMGRCVNIRAGNPKYYWRYPEMDTLINGKKIPENGAELMSGDIFRIGDIEIRVTC